MRKIDYPARMIALERLCDRLGPSHPRHALVDRMMQRMLLSAGMTERLGIAKPASELTGILLCELELGCFECAARHRCRQWQDDCQAEGDCREFCPNAGLFEALLLPRKDDAPASEAM